jgi:hypothetical protein
MKTWWYTLFFCCIGFSSLPAEDAMFQFELKLDAETIRLDQEITFSLVIKNISNEQRRLNALQFIRNAGSLHFSYNDGNNDGPIRIRPGYYMTVSYLLPDERFIILEPSETIEFYTKAIYKYIEMEDISTLTLYTGKALVFKFEAMFFPIVSGIQEITVRASFHDEDNNLIFSNEVIARLEN